MLGSLSLLYPGLESFCYLPNLFYRKLKLSMIVNNPDPTLCVDDFIIQSLFKDLMPL